MAYGALISAVVFVAAVLLIEASGVLFVIAFSGSTWLLQAEMAVLGLLIMGSYAWSAHRARKRIGRSD